MPIQVSLLAERDIPGAVAAIQEAFADDPYNNWIFDKAKFDPKRNAVSLGIRCRWGMRNGIFHVAKEEGSDEVLGVACWLRPQRADQPPTWYDIFESWRLSFNQLCMNIWYGRGGLNTKFSFLKRYWIWKAAQDKVQSTVWTDPRGYYFLNIMVVLPKAQSRGIGRLMMEAVTEPADSENMPCYLESSRKVPNIQIYERFGFKSAGELECDDDGTAIKLFAMTREPYAGPSSDESKTPPDGSPAID
ncbi:acyl-CoA N-acyltransferase [Xylaria sp. CBS 124048]|nr:acyl-CoA N-acyltransferase [Xylaria sp. CBS 124048]